MKNRYIYALLAAIAVLSCSKQEGARIEGARSAADELLTFKADLGSSKSYFWDYNDPTLYWSDYDDVTVYGVYVGESTHELNEYAAGLSIGEPLEKYLVGTHGSLTSYGSPETRIITGVTRENFVNAINDQAGDDEMFIFTAIYPAHGETKKFVRFWDGIINGEPDILYGMPCTVPTVQNADDGIGRYHICVDHGFDLNSPDTNFGCISKSEILAGKEVTFNHFEPSTSIIMFTTQSSDGNYYSLSRIRIIVEDAIALTGDCYMCSQKAINDMLFYKEGYVNNYVDLKLNYFSVQPYENENYLMAVVMPSYASGLPYEYIHNGNKYRGLLEINAWPCNKYSNSRVLFYGYDDSDKLVLKGEKTAPGDGFLAGGRYRTTVTLYPANLDSGAAEDGPGSYLDGSDTFEQI